MVAKDLVQNNVVVSPDNFTSLCCNCTHIKNNNNVQFTNVICKMKRWFPYLLAFLFKMC